MSGGVRGPEISVTLALLSFTNEAEFIEFFNVEVLMDCFKVEELVNCFNVESLMRILWSMLF